jgi:hypothetical protein
MVDEQEQDKQVRQVRLNPSLSSLSGWGVLLVFLTLIIAFGVGTTLGALVSKAWYHDVRNLPKDNSFLGPAALFAPFVVLVGVGTFALGARVLKACGKSITRKGRH